VRGTRPPFTFFYIKEEVIVGGCNKRDWCIHTNLSHAFEVCCPTVVVFDIRMNSRGGLSANRHVEKPIKLTAALLSHGRKRSNAFVPCRRRHESGASSNIQCEFPHSLVSGCGFFLRCVCTAPSLRLPAVPEGQADQTGVPDALPPRSLSRRRRGLPHRHLSHLHRSVCRQTCGPSSKKEMVN